MINITTLVIEIFDIHIFAPSLVKHGTRKSQH